MLKDIVIIYQDADVAVVDKPAGVAVIPAQNSDAAETLAGALEKKLNQKIWAVHTIDKDASGVLIFAKNTDTYKDISAQFENSKVYRKYIALLSGVLEESGGTIRKHVLISGRDVSINAAGKETVTNFKILEKFKSYTLVEAVPLTSVRNQIRLHFWSLGHPLAVDSEYGIADPVMLSSFKRRYKFKKNGNEKPLISRLTLHAEVLSLMLHSTGQIKTFESPLPKDFELTLKQLKKYAG
ncbi:MAG: RluA family pseudouridine synthase [Endomicrobium sp.]|jgi:23S rRNA pseudouridine955/2504/2580 synthase/23S rRNA pseudouridine1911/1915/1917 synthase|nr:RluA family pseudouridine synthase [Endomicrobium sp.]